MHIADEADVLAAPRYITSSPLCNFFFITPLLLPTQDLLDGMYPSRFTPDIVPDDENRLWWDVPPVFEELDQLGAYPRPVIHDPPTYRLTSDIPQRHRAARLREYSVS